MPGRQSERKSCCLPGEGVRMKLEGQLYPFYHKRPKISYFMNHTWKIYDGKQPNYYTKLSIKIPCPKSAEDPPIILVTLHNAKRSFFMTFAGIEDLEHIFNLQDLAISANETYENLRARIERELKNAAMAQAILDQATQKVHEAANK